MLKHLYLAVVCVLLLSACAPSTIAVLKASDATITVVAHECSSAVVKEELARQKIIGLAMGIPADEVKRIIESFKDATVVTDADGKKTMACAADLEDYWYIIDENGNQGPLAKK